MKKAVERVLSAAAKNEKVLIYGDYDVDGVTSSTMLNKLLTALGLPVEVYLPHRENEGYGMNKEVIKRFADKGFTLLISSDCGISNFDEIDLANKSGMDVIIFDHHLPPEKFRRLMPSSIQSFRRKLILSKICQAAEWFSNSSKRF